MQRNRMLAFIVVLLSAASSGAAPPDDDPPALWKIGVGCAAATIALSGVVGAVAHGPLVKAAQPLGPAVTSSITPTTIAVATAIAGAVTGVTLVATAELIEESPMPEAARSQVATPRAVAHVATSRSP